MTPVFVQFKYFLNTVAIGLIIGIIFDFYRAIRFLVRPRKWTADVLDVFMSIIFTAMAFLLLLFSNWGEVRLYVFLGIGLGIGVYVRYCSGKILSWWFNWLSFFTKSTKLILKIFYFPVKMINRLIALPLGLISLLLYNLYKFLNRLTKKPASKVKSVAKGLLKVFHRPKKP